jgi:hypothetical protein
MAELEIDADYSVTSVFTDQPLRDDTGSMNCGVDNGPVVLRIALRFDVSDIPAGSSVSAAVVTTEQWQSFDVDAKTWRYGPYDGDGLADPQADSDADLYAGTDLASTSYQESTIHRTDALHQVTLDAAAHGDIEAAIAAGGTYTVVIQDTDEATQGRLFRIFGHDQGGEGQIPQLSVTYEEGQQGGGESSGRTSSDGGRWGWR